MTRLEKYKDVLIPVDDVAYVEYRKPDKSSWDESESAKGTYVRIRSGYAYGTIKISDKNVLDDFKKWYDETMNRIGSNTCSGGVPGGGWWTCTTSENIGEEPFDISPHAVWSTATVQHDGVEHPL